MLGAISTPVSSRPWTSIPGTTFPAGYTNPLPKNIQISSPLSTLPLHFSFYKESVKLFHLSLRASSSSSSSSVGGTEYTQEPATKVKFQTSLNFPGCSSSLSLLGTGYREKVFAIIGVKVYAAGLYVSPSILSTLSAWKGQTASEIQDNSALFSSIFQATSEKSLQIILVRDVDGKTFWDALDDAISPRIKASTPVDESALSTFRSIFQGRSLSKETYIILTWLDPSKMLVSISSDGIPARVDATIESKNVTFALFDVFFGDAPVSPSLKSSVSTRLATALK